MVVVLGCRFLPMVVVVSVLSRLGRVCRLILLLHPVLARRRLPGRILKQHWRDRRLAVVVVWQRPLLSLEVDRGGRLTSRT